MPIAYQSHFVYAGSYNGFGLAFAGKAASRQALDDFVAANEGAFGHDGMAEAVREALDGYTSAFFEDKMLVLAVIDAGSGSARLEVDKVEATGGQLVVTISDIPLDSGMMGTADMARFLALVELPAEYAGLPAQVVY